VTTTDKQRWQICIQCLTDKLGQGADFDVMLKKKRLTAKYLNDLNEPWENILLIHYTTVCPECRFRLEHEVLKDDP
jgi:hypothetical protein